MGVALVVAFLVLSLVVLALLIRFERRPATRAAEDDRLDVPDVSPVPVAAEDPTITWTAQLTAATLDEAARLQLIDDLVMLRAAWSVTLLQRAREEEHAPQVRARIDEALAACAEPIETTV